MTTLKAIATANEIRPNTFDDEMKASLLYELDNKCAEFMEREQKENIFPLNDELSMPSPYDNIYELYLIAMIDYYNQDLELYANDIAVYYQALYEAKSHWRRTHTPNKTNYFKVW